MIFNCVFGVFKLWFRIKIIHNFKVISTRITSISMKLFLYFCLTSISMKLFRNFFNFCNAFFIKEIFVVLLYKYLVEFLSAPTTLEVFLARLIVLENLQEVSGFSIITEFMSIMFRFSILFGYWVIISDRLTNFLFLFFKYNS